MAGLEKLKSLFSEIEPTIGSDVTSLNSDLDNITSAESNPLSSMTPTTMNDVFGEIGRAVDFMGGSNSYFSSFEPSIPGFTLNFNKGGYSFADKQIGNSKYVGFESNLLTGFGGLFNNEITARSLSNIGSIKYSENFREINLPTLDHIVNFGNIAELGNPNVSGVGYSTLQPKLDAFREVSGEGFFFEGIKPTGYFEPGRNESVIGVKGSTKTGNHEPNLKASTWFYSGVPQALTNFNTFNTVDDNNQRRTGFVNGDFATSARTGFSDLKTPYTIDKFSWIDKRLVTQEFTTQPSTFRKSFRLPDYVSDVIGLPPIQDALDGKGVFDAQSMFWPFTGVDAGSFGITTEEFYFDLTKGDVFSLNDELGEFNTFKTEFNPYIAGAARWMSLLGYNAPGNSVDALVNPLLENIFGASLKEITDILTNPASIIEKLFEVKPITYANSVFELTEGMVRNRSQGIPTDEDAPVLEKTGQMFNWRSTTRGIPMFDNPYRGIVFQTLGARNNPDGSEELPGYEDIISNIEFGRSSGIDPNNIDSLFDTGNDVTDIISAINSAGDFNPFPPGSIVPAKSNAQPKLDYSYQFLVQNTLGFQLPFDIKDFGNISFSMPDGATGPWKEFSSLVWPFEHFTFPTFPNVDLKMGDLGNWYNNSVDYIRDGLGDIGDLIANLFDLDEIGTQWGFRDPDAFPIFGWLEDKQKSSYNRLDAWWAANKPDLSPSLETSKEFKEMIEALKSFPQENILSKYLLIPTYTGLTNVWQSVLTYDYEQFLTDNTKFITESELLKTISDKLGGAWEGFSGATSDFTKGIVDSFEKPQWMTDAGAAVGDFFSGIGGGIGDAFSKFDLPSISFSGGSMGKIDFTGLAKDLAGALSLVGELGLNLNPISEFEFPSIDIQNPMKKTDYGGQAKYAGAWGPPTGKNEPRHLNLTYPVKTPTLGDMIRTDVSSMTPTFITDAESTPYAQLQNPATHKAPNLKKNIRGMFYPSKLQALSSIGTTAGAGDSHTIAPLERDYKNFTKGGKHPIEDPSFGMPFYFKDMRDGTYITFRGYIEGLTENISPSWTSENYIGRSEPVYIYERAERDISFSLKLFAQTKLELFAIYAKLRRLSSLCYPEYHPDLDLQKLRMKPPIAKFRIGELYGNMFNQGITGFIKSLSYSIPDTSPWETDMFQRVPKHISAALSYQVIHDSPPDKLTKFYGVSSPIETADLKRG